MNTLHPDVRIGHVHLRVADLRPLGLGGVFLAAGSYHHIALNASEPAGAAPPPAGHTGLHHVAVVFPDRAELADPVDRLFEHDYPVTSAYDHQATVSVFVRDPGGNGLELYYDRPRHEWFDDAGRPVVKNERLEPSTFLN